MLYIIYVSDTFINACNLSHFNIWNFKFYLVVRNRGVGNECTSQPQNVKKNEKNNNFGILIWELIPIRDLPKLFYLFCQ